MKTIVAIVCITIVIVTCIITHTDGTITISGIALMAGLGGYAAGSAKKEEKK